MELYNNLKKLSILIKEEVLNRYAAGNLEYSLQDYVVFETTIEDNGVYSTKNKKISVISWYASYMDVLRDLEGNPDFIEIKDFLNECFQKNFNQIPTEGVRVFPMPEEIIKRFIFAYLYNHKVDDSEIESLIDILIKESEGKPLKYEIKAELKGIYLDINKIKINEQCTLRKPEKEDLIKYFHADVTINSFQKKEATCPSSILEIEFEDIMDRSLFKLIDAIRILRLYKVGNVKCILSRTYSESFNFPENDLTSHVLCESINNRDKEIAYTLTENDVEKIRDFWNTINYSISNLDSKGYLSIAFERYNSALKTEIGIFNNGSIERKITEAVMGLEILFLKDDESNRHLARKLSRRISKFMKLIGYQNLDHETLIEIAYDIRSEYLHMGKLRKETEDKLNQFYSLNEFVKVIIDYLRVSLIVLLIIDKDRDYILNLIIGSLNNGRTEDKILFNIFADVKGFI